MENKKLVIGLAPTRRDTRDFELHFAHERKAAVEARIRQIAARLGAEVINIDFLNEEGLLIFPAEAERVAEVFRHNQVDCVIVPHVNFGAEEALLLRLQLYLFHRAGGIARHRPHNVHHSRIPGDYCRQSVRRCSDRADRNQAGLSDLFRRSIACIGSLFRELPDWQSHLEKTLPNLRKFYHGSAHLRQQVIG